jgi:hypothetical protein
MANFIYSQVTIEPTEAMDKICDMIEAMPSVEYGKETTQVVKTFYTEDDLNRPYNNGETEYPITDSGVKHGWLYDNVGTKWITVGVDDTIRIESPSYIPDGFLVKLFSICCEDFDNVTLECRWYDETETQCGFAMISDGIYTEDEEYLSDEDISDPAYEVTGDEDIDDVKEWLLSQVNEDSYMKPSEIEEMEEDDLRDLFQDWKSQGKWDYMSDAQDGMRDSCIEAIETQDFDFPVSKVKRVANRRFKMMENAYPF